MEPKTGLPSLHRGNACLKSGLRHQPFLALTLNIKHHFFIFCFEAGTSIGSLGSHRNDVGSISLENHE